MKSLRKLLTFLAISLALTAAVLASDITDYQQRVRSARSGVQELLSNAAIEAAGDKPERPDAEIFAEIGKQIPGREKIVAAGGTVETDNLWLSERLKAAQAEVDRARRVEILQGIEGRLAVLGVRLQELKDAAAAERSKDEDKRTLSEILSRPEYQKPAKSDVAEESLLSKWIRQFLEWLEGFFPQGAAGEAPLDVTRTSTVVQWILIGAIILLLGLLAYKLIPSLSRRFSREESNEKESRVILGETIESDVSSVDLFAHAERLAREGDLRGAIRKGYVALLCEMSDRKIIGLARHKTNRDYLCDVKDRPTIHTQMSGITRTFERHWYGSMDARPDDWEEFRRRYGETIKTI